MPSLRRVTYALGAVVVAWALLAVPMPFVVYAPGGAVSVAELVQLDTDTTPISGELDLLTVRAITPAPADLAAAAIDGAQDVVPLQEVLPDQVNRSDFRAIQAAQFDRSFDTAVGVGARAAGLETDVVQKPVVLRVLEGPAVGRLSVGDVIEELDGQAVGTAQELVDALGATGGEPVTVAVRRSDGTEDVTVDPEPGPDGEPRLGILVETVVDEVELPFDAQLGDTNIIGPSAGMMLAVTTADLLLDEDLAAGRRIAGTGTVNGDGRVGPIGSVREKVLTAQQAEADLLLIPQAQLGTAQAAADGSVEIVGVETVEDAVEALRR